MNALAEYIARDSRYYAAAFIQELRDASRSLVRFSERGRIVPELGENAIRELLIHEYRMIYQVRNDQVLILGIIHGRRDLKRVWQGKKE
ncbi:MAG TPA: type II toxin-antitoxin system RelE/ParE family toxin [Bacteroidota bacterium]